MEKLLSWIADTHGERWIPLAKQLHALGIAIEGGRWNIRTLIESFGPAHVRAQLDWARKHKPAGWLNAGKCIAAITQNWGGFDHEREAARRELAAVQARRAAQQSTRERDRRDSANTDLARGNAAIDAHPIDELRAHVLHAIDKYYPVASGGIFAQTNARKKRELEEGDDAAVRALAKQGPVGSHLRLTLRGYA